MERQTPEFDQKDIDEGQNARRLLEDDTFQTALKRATERMKAQWVVADTRKRREELHAQVVALENVVVELMTTVGDGKQAQHLKTRQEALGRGSGTSIDEGEQADD